MRRTWWGFAPLLLICVAVVLAACDGPNRGSVTQPSSASGMNLALVASPNVIRGQTAGSDETGGCSNVQAKVFDTHGQLVDNIEVRFTTSMCCFVVGTDDTIVSATITTVLGVANITYCANKVRGTNIVTGSVEDAFATVLITIL